ncbi:MAG: DUF2905 domain-containing protein [Anaerolineae bacterium]|nr:DUF2905 domain-containing protein [Anaerolineae bacterium]
MSLNFESIGWFLLVSGAILALMGVGAIVLARLGVPVGSLPGDLVVQRGSVTVFAPVMSCLVVSIVVNVAIWLLRR